jgi:threonine dehydrogenase-like Zn-dependent dehydrogenase
MVVVRSESRRSLCAELGLEAIGIDSADSLARQFDLVVDATGAPEGFARAQTLVRPRGTLVLKSTFHGETPVAFSPLVVDEITIVGSRCGPFQTAIDALASRRIDVAPLIDGIYPLERFADAFERARGGRKQILMPEAEGS